ncbi:hypothetical protein BC938DRAFT_472002 [Jimgerdemannia flammicorona]|uniref:Uncharacterized protein n=1 Tax=Jimgerdemannia flammicorona TaxID=994334 RepID=A0A433QZX7_9FUNG|nr:hypothetical protein BC938DRAFT_472002 [Jimgerdemannia flammicorona]
MIVKYHIYLVACAKRKLKTAESVLNIGEADNQMNTTAFELVGKSLFKMSVNELANLATETLSVYDDIFRNIVGKTYTISIRAKYVSASQLLQSMIMSMVSVVMDE